MDLPHNKTIGGGTQTEPTTFLWKNECESDLRVMYARVTKWWHYVQKIEVKAVNVSRFHIYLSHRYWDSHLGNTLSYNTIFTHATHHVAIAHSLLCHFRGHFCIARDTNG